MRTLGLLLLLMFLGTAAAAAKAPVALVIGNSAYRAAASLPNPVNDAAAIGGALRSLGFDVDVQTDLTLPKMKDAVRAFGDRLQGAPVGLFFYSGHAVQVKGVNYLLPIDARLAKERDVEWELIDLRLVLKEMDGEQRINLVFLDACRDNPLASRMMTNDGARSAPSRGLARVNASTGTLISFATQEGETATDGKGRNSPYTAAILRHMGTPDLEVALMLRKVRQDVRNATGGQQTPWEYGSLLGEFYFKPTRGNGADDDASQAFLDIVNSTDPAEFDAFAAKYPNSRFAAAARQRAALLRTPAVAPAPPKPKPATDDRQWLDGRVGYLHIASFQSTTADRVDKAIAALQREANGRLEGLVLDLRGSGGDGLEPAVMVADRFLEAVDIIALRHPSDPDENRRYSATHGDLLTGLPMAVLTDAASGFASEIVAAALQDHGRAILFGTTTAGNGPRPGTVSSAGATKYRFLRPANAALACFGVTPNLTFGPRPPRSCGTENAPAPPREWPESTLCPDVAAQPSNSVADRPLACAMNAIRTRLSVSVSSTSKESQEIIRQRNALDELVRRRDELQKVVDTLITPP